MKIEKYESINNGQYKIYLSDGTILKINSDVIINNNLLYKKEIDNTLLNKILKENLDKIERGLEGLNFEKIGEGMAYFKNDGKSYKEIRTFLDSYLNINLSGYMVLKIKDTVSSLKRHPIYKMPC